MIAICEFQTPLVGSGQRVAPIHDYVPLIDVLRLSLKADAAIPMRGATSRGIDRERFVREGEPMKTWNAPAWMMASFIAGIVFSYSSCGGGGGTSQEDPGDGPGTADAAPSDADFAALAARVTELETLLGAVTVNENGDMVLTGINLYVQSGSGASGGTVNGKGNLIVGYHEDAGSDAVRTGSHNVIVGPEHSFTGFGGLVAGSGNRIDGQYSSVVGGQGNRAFSDYTAILGGQANLAGDASFVDPTIGEYATVSAGRNNIASGDWSSISGGGSSSAENGQVASGDYATVSGGINNTASGQNASVSGGETNTASGDFASVSGGYDNTASGARASVSGGSSNDASLWFTSVSGGEGNTASANYSSVSGGINNTASGSHASVSGGINNTASANYSSVSGGEGCNTGAVTRFWGFGDQTVDAGCSTTQTADF